MSEPIDDPGSSPSELERESKRAAEDAAQHAAARRAARPHIQLRRSIRPQEVFALIGGFGLYGLLLVTTITPIIHPIFPLGALVFFLYPFRKGIVARRMMQLGIATFLVWLFLNLSGVLFPFIVAFIIAYLFAPVVRRLDNHGIPSWATALAILLGMLGIYTLIGVFIIPSLIQQFDELVSQAQQILKGADTYLDKNMLARELTRLGLTRKQAEDLVTNQIEPQLQLMMAWLFSGFGSFMRSVTSIVEGLFNLILIPALAFYMMLDFKRIRLFVRSTVMQDNPKYVYYIKRVDTILNSYLRGILLTSGIVGGLAVGILSAFNVPYAVLIGILTGVLNLIPTVGMFINLGVAMLIYIFSPGDFWVNTLITAIMIFGLHGLNSYIIEPRIIGDRVGLHPVLVIASLFIFAHFLGFIGLLIAVPTSAVILMFLREWYQQAIALKRPVVTNQATPAQAQ